MRTSRLGSITELNRSQALIVASNGPYRQIKESTTGILFLGTPHRQTKNLDKARIGLRVVHVLGFRTDPVLREISSSDYLADQNDRFKSMLEQTTIKVYSFYENRIRGFPLQGGVVRIFLPVIINASCTES